MSLVRILRGDEKGWPGTRSLHPEARSSAGFGALAFRSQIAVERLLDRLESNGYLRARRLDNGGVVLDLTPEGKSALQTPAHLEALLDPVDELPRASPSETSKDDETELDVDEALFTKLRAWRLEQARVNEVPPYIVFHDSHLRSIAARRPVTLDALSKVKGVGPRRLETFGPGVIELVRTHIEGETRDAKA